MVSDIEAKFMRKMARIIEDNGEIHQWDLVKKVNIPIKKFYELKSFFLYEHRHEFDFDKKTKSFFIKLEYKNTPEPGVKASNLNTSGNDLKPADYIKDSLIP